MTNINLKSVSMAVLMALAFSPPTWANNKDKKAISGHAVINYSLGQNELTAADKIAIKQVVDSARANGQKIETVEVAVWSDQSFPLNNEDLSRPDRELASRRADQIEFYLKKDLGLTRVKAFNMAESSNWLARAFNTDSAELKSTFNKQSSPEMTREDFNIIRDKGASSKAVIVVKRQLTEEVYPREKVLMP